MLTYKAEQAYKDFDSDWKEQMINQQDIIERLRVTNPYHGDVQEAASEIQRLRRLNKDWQDAASEAATTAQGVVDGLRRTCAELTQERDSLRATIIEKNEAYKCKKKHLTAFLRRLEQEMRYAGWGEKQADNYERAELYAEVCEFLGDK